MTGDSPAILAFRRLAVAVVLRAARDAQGGNGYAAEARRWLAGEGADLTEQLGLPPERVAGWLRGLEPVRQPALPGL